MDPWRIGGDYDRPIPRRILEQQGVRRDKFGIRKLASISSWQRFHFNNSEQQNDLKIFFELNGKRMPGQVLGGLIDIVRYLRVKLEELSRKKKFVKFAQFVRLQDYSDLLFVWANARLARSNYPIVPQESAPKL